MCGFYVFKQNRQQNKKCPCGKIRICSVASDTNPISTSLSKTKQTKKELKGSINWEKKKRCCATVMAGIHHIPLIGLLVRTHKPPYTYFFPDTQFI